MHAVTLSRHAVCESSIHSIKPIKYENMFAKRKEIKQLSLLLI